MSDDLTDSETIPRARELARQALGAINFSEDATGIADLIADLMHLADELDDEDGEDGYAVISTAERHYEAELPRTYAIQVKIENTYAVGHSCPPRLVKFESVSDTEIRDLESDFWEQVWQETGCYCTPQVSQVVGSLYTATIETCDDHSLVGISKEWSD